MPVSVCQAGDASGASESHRQALKAKSRAVQQQRRGGGGGASAAASPKKAARQAAKKAGRS
jgi:hypothetical protein